MVQDQGLLLVEGAGVVPPGRLKAAGTVIGFDHRGGQRRTVDVNVKDVHEDGDPQGAAVQVVAFQHLTSGDDLAVRRGHQTIGSEGMGRSGSRKK